LIDVFRADKIAVTAYPSLQAGPEPAFPENLHQDVRSIIEHVQEVSSSPEQDRWAAIRALDMLSAAGDFSKLLPVVAAFVRHADPHVRSKAALLMGRASHTLAWVEHALEDADDRVRANAIESIWRVSLPRSVPLLQRALEDPSNRVAGNAAVGLHLLGDPAGAQALERMANHEDPMFRASAAWGMGMLGDPAFTATAFRLREDQDPKVRHLALRCLARLRSRSAETAEAGA
jgi:HEAT repeat protein